MATPDHTPHGRGHMTALNYFHHCNDYWSMVDGAKCPTPAPTPPAPLPSAKCGAPFPSSHWCAGNSPNMPGGHATSTAAECCDMCTNTTGCEGWAWGKNKVSEGEWSCFLKSKMLDKQIGKADNCTSACRIGEAKCLTQGGRYCGSLAVRTLGRPLRLRPLRLRPRSLVRGGPRARDE
jgi:hypothetical protein